MIKKTTALPAVDLLKTTTDFISDMKYDISDDNIDWLGILEQESSNINAEIEGRL
jgi:hypothetical protein